MRISTKFKEICETTDNVEEIVIWDRINCKNPGKTRTELLYLFKIEMEIPLCSSV